MNLDESQKARVAEWVGQGCTIAEVQSRLAAELGMRLTYMDVRFLIDDLKLKPKDIEPPKPAAPMVSPTAPAGTAAPAANPSVVPEPEPGVSSVSVQVDQVAKPGALVSGRVRFSDGKSADWYLDQYGRLGLVPEEQGYRPPQPDVMEFQAQLQEQLGRLGY